MLPILPTELLEFVADYLDSDDVGALRLTCRDSWERLQHFFAHKYLTTLHFVLEDINDLFVLLSISRNVLYRRAVQRLSFSTIKNKRSQAACTDEQHDAVRARDGDLNTIYKGDLDSNIMTMVLKNLAAAGVRPIVETSRYLPGRYASAACVLGGEWTCRKGYRMFNFYRKRPFTAIWHGLSSNQSRITHLSLGARHSEISIDAFAEMPPRNWCCHLKSFKLWVFQSSRRQGIDEQRCRAAANILRLIVAAEGLHTLHLIFIGAPDEFVTQSLATNSLPELKELSLSGLQTPLFRLRRFMEQHETTLAGLDLGVIYEASERKTQSQLKELFLPAARQVNYSLSFNRALESQE